VPVGRVTATLGSDLVPATETLAGLGILQQRIGRVDGVLGFDVAPLGGQPVHFHASADVSVKHGLSLSFSRGLCRAVPWAGRFPRPRGQ
jgi:hypothetical protein